MLMMEEKARKKIKHNLTYILYIHVCMSLSFSCVGSIYNFVSSLHSSNKGSPYVVFIFEPNYLRKNLLCENCNINFIFPRSEKV